LFDAIQKKLSSINLGEMHEDYTHYCKLSGTDPFRQKLSMFFNKFMSPVEKTNADDVFVMNGCGTVIESLGYSLCNEGDGVLIPAPYYTGFKSDLEQRIGVKTIPVQLQCKGSNAFAISLQLLEEALEDAEERGVPVKALLLSNPNNPLGTVYTEEELKMMAEFCYNNNLHLICDEIYMLSVYDEETKFKSILSIKNFEKYRDIIHVVWGFSKDFSLSGFRVGVAITKNTALQSSLASVGYYTSVSTPTQYILEEMITDTEWLNQLVTLNHQRLNRNRYLVSKTLKEEKISFIQPNSGLFIWMNLSKCMKGNTVQCETELFEKLMSAGLYLVPGQAFETKESGWFRMIISNNIDILNIALKRLVALIRDSTTAQHLKRCRDIERRRLSNESVQSLEKYIRLLKSKRRSHFNRNL
ncbi:MAG: aminotransferase class I/II-fold pyridoxal phosphate-dependent enzyme, partial [Cyanobacteria bacterium J06649_11]